MELLIPLLLALALVTLVGHAIWVVLAAIVRALAGSGGQQAGQPLRQFLCPRCLSPLATQSHPCSVCNWPAPLAKANSPELAKRLLLRQLEQLRQSSVIDVETRDSLAATLTTKSSAAEPATDEPIVLEMAEKQEAAPLPSAPPHHAPSVKATPPVAPPQRPQPQEVGQRAARYRQQRDAAAAEASDQPPPPTDARRATLAKLLSAFMEEKNIRWGELVGGLLIVFCSIALVISFWSEIAERPFLKFFLFNGVTAALYGLGLYAHKKWKLRTTSHGLLITATLLVPLNFLAIAAFTQASPPTDAPSIGGELVSIIVFALLVFAAERVVTPDASLLLTVGVIVPSVMQLLARRFISPTATLPLIYTIAIVPIACYIIPLALALWRRLADAVFDEAHANRLLILLGIMSYSFVLPIGLIVFKTGNIGASLQGLSPLIAVAGMPSLATGLLFAKRPMQSLAGLKTAGMSCGVLGGLVMLAAIALAWPDPRFLLCVALVDAGIFLALAVRMAIPQAHLAAGACLAIASLVMLHWMGGAITWQANTATMVAALISAGSGKGLAVMAIAYAAIACVLGRASHPPAARCYFVLSAGSAGVSLVLVTWFGFARWGDPQGVTWVYALYTVAVIAAALFTQRHVLIWIGSTLLLAALMQGVVFAWGDGLQMARPWAFVLLLHAGIVAVFASTLRYVAKDAGGAVSTLCQGALFTSTVALAILVIRIVGIPAAAFTPYVAALAVVWLMTACASRWPAMIVAFQLALVATTMSATTALVEDTAWYGQAGRPWLDPWFLSAQGIGLATYCILCCGLRIGTRRRAKESELIGTLLAGRLAVDRLLAAGVVALSLFIGTYAAVPGAMQELTPNARPRAVPAISQFELVGMDHTHASDNTTWILLLATASMLVVGLWESHAEYRLLGLLVVAIASCPLLASQWEADVAVATALRWITAGLFVLAVVPIWMRRPMARATSSWSWVRTPNAFALNVNDIASISRTYLIAAVAVVYVASFGYTTVVALNKAGIASAVGPLFPYLMTMGLVMGGSAIALAAFARRGAVSTSQEVSNRLVGHLPTLLAVIGIAPLIVALLFALAAALRTYPIVGPNPDSWFRQIGWAASVGVPLLWITLGLIGHAARERSAAYAFIAALLSLLNATAAFMLLLPRWGRPLDAVAWIQVAQINATVAALFALAWYYIINWHRRKISESEEFPAPQTLPRMLITLSMLAICFCAAFILPAAGGIALHPVPLAWITAAGNWLGWLAIGSTFASAACIIWRRFGRMNAGGVWGIAIAVPCMLAVTAANWDTGNWLAFHVLLVGSTTAAWFVTLTPRWSLVGNRAATWCAVVVGGIASLLAIRASIGDPQAPWWTVATLVAISVLAVRCALLVAWPVLLHVAALWINFAVTIWWLSSGNLWTGATGLAALFELIHYNVIAAALLVPAWVRVDLRIARRMEHETRRIIAAHRVVTFWCVAVVMLLVSLSLLADVSANPLADSHVLGWFAVLLTAGAVASCLRDANARWPVVGLYLIGLAITGRILDQVSLTGDLFVWMLTLLLAGFALASSYLWSRREMLAATASRLGLWPSQRHQSSASHGWVVTANSILSAAVTLLAFRIVLTFDMFTQRMMAAYAILLVAISIGLLAGGRLRSSLQYASLLLGVLFAVAFAWSWQSPEIVAPLIRRSVAAGAATAAMFILYGLGLLKLLRRDTAWTAAALRLVPWLVGVAGCCFALALGMEVVYFARSTSVPVDWPTIMTIAVALGGMCLAALAAAVLPGRDPLQLTDRGRQAYVYAAEVILALLFLHIRITMPWLFSGWFVAYWPLVVMGIAFIGVGVAEVLHRQRQRVVSEPLQTTGALLPMLPVLGFWILPGQVDYSLLLLSVGGLYTVLAALRKSLFFAMLAVLAANGSLWSLLYRADGLGLSEHPQLWLIPPALCALVAAQLNRKQLTESQLTAIRYASAIVIYVASTADVFLVGVATAPWLPLVLAGVSIAGVFAGILLRVRAFLFMGIAFLLVSLLTMIWYAAVELERTWIWWVSGIVTGVLIIALFALFEKRRDDVLRTVENLRHWEA